MLSQYPRTVVTIAFIFAALLIVIGLIYPRFLMRKTTHAERVPAMNSIQAEQQAAVIQSDEDPDPGYADIQNEEEVFDEATSSIEIM